MNDTYTLNCINDFKNNQILKTIESNSHKRVLIINTGGTIGMLMTDKGYAPGKGQIQKVLEEISHLHNGQIPEISMLEYSPLLDSTNITSDEWVKMAKDIVAHEKDFDGFVILHGTDTMAYTASALSFMLDGLDRPVILTGSQIPLCRPRNDGRENLITAILLAAYSKIPEVCIAFGGKLLRGNRATKISADQLQAFASPNFPVLAEAGVDLRLFPHLFMPAGNGISLKPFTEQKIGVLKIFPGIQFSLFENLVEKGMNGLILEAFGVGNIPALGSLKNLLNSCTSNKIPTVVLTQCPQGRARLGEYASSSELCDMGAINGADLTVEAAVTKLTYLLSIGKDFDSISRIMTTNLHGEISDDYLKSREI